MPSRVQIIIAVQSEGFQYKGHVNNSLLSGLGRLPRPGSSFCGLHDPAPVAIKCRPASISQAVPSAPARSSGLSLQLTNHGHITAHTVITQPGTAYNPSDCFIIQTQN